MFERIGRAAERAAAGVSRRRFLGRLGQAAAAAAGVLGALAAPADAEAAVKCNGQLCPPRYDYCCKVPDPLAPHGFVRVCSATPCK